MSIANQGNKLLRPLYLATAMTLLAEAVYFVVWGLLLFPRGDVAGKAMWTLTCGIAMGAVIGGLTIILVENRLSGGRAALAAAAIMTVVGSYCSFLCSRIDAKFGYFGGPEQTALFIVGGVIPAFLGGLVYGWLLYLKSGNRAAVRLRLWRPEPQG